MELAVFRSKGDPQADEVIQIIQPTNPGFWQSREWKSFSFNSDIPDSSWPGELLSLISDTEALPAWAQPKLLSQSQLFFNKHQSLIFLCLGLYSLPYCYAGANGVKVLFHTKRLRESPGMRLEETGSFVLDVCEPGAFESKGKGFRSILKVRLMHALARYYLKDQPFWLKEWGLPVNQEDMAGTNVAFSLIVLRGLRKLGVDISREQANGFLHYWDVVGALLGVEAELRMGSPRNALRLESAIAKRNFKQSAEGMELTASLRGHIEAEMKASPINLPVAALMEYLLGPELSAMLGLQSSGTDKLQARSVVTLTKLQGIAGFDFLSPRQRIERVNL